MLILNDKPGQLCNRLWAFSFFIAYAQKHSLKIYIPHFREYQQYFDNLSALPNVFFFNIWGMPKILDTVTFHMYRVGARVLRILNCVIDLKVLNIYIDHKHWTEEQWPLSVLKCKNKLIFLGSWLQLKDVCALLEYKQQILMLFEPAKRYQKRVDLIFEDILKQYDIIIGIHIRRSDYSEFHGGAYYYDDDVYKRYMRLIQKKLLPMNVCFYLSSDRPMMQSVFMGFETVRLQNPVMVEDLYALSKCHYIFGPPSTFSMWASFIGDRPLRILKYRDEEITMEQFSPILYQNYFKNGERFRHVDAPDRLSPHEISLAGCIEENA